MEKKFLALICATIIGICLLIYLTLPAQPIETKLSYSVSGCEKQEEKEYTKTRALEQKVDIETNDSFVKLTHYLNYVCCANIKVYLESVEPYQNYTLIKLKEKNEGQMCRCVCDYKVNMTVGPLQKGNYLIQIYGIEYNDMPVELLWEKEIQVTEKTSLPNPASAYCIDHGGKLEIRKDNEGNEYGVCIFPNGSECDEWAFYRGECSPT